MQNETGPLAKTDLPNVPCVILAGGGSTRFGSVKGLAKLGGKSLVRHVAERLKKQTSGPVAINAPDENAYASLRCDIIPDILDDDLGPLSGIYTAICWAESHGFADVITVPVDSPFFPDTLISQLSNAGSPAVAEHGKRLHPVFGLWPVSLAVSLRDSMDQGVLALHAWAEISGAQRVLFANHLDADPFFNINTQRDLQTASARLAPSPTTDRN